MKKSKGMLTIEAALVMPLVIYTVFIMIFTFLFIYTRVYVALSTNFVVAQATAQWYSTGSDFDVSLAGGSIIGQAIGMSTSTTQKEKIIVEKIKKRIDEGSPMEVDISKTNAKVSNYIVGQKLDINVECKYKLPLSGLFKIMGMTKDGTITDNYTKTYNLSNSEDIRRTITYASTLIDEALEKIKEALGGKK